MIYFRFACLFMIFWIGTCHRKSLEIDSGENSESESLEPFSQHLDTDDRENSVEYPDIPQSRSYTDNDDSNSQQKEMISLRNKIPQPPPKQGEIGAPNAFNLPNLSQNERKDIYLLEGDIAVSSSRNAFIQSSKWPGGVVPYELAWGYTQTEMSVIKSAMATITRNSGNCIKFVPRASHSAWVRIHSGQGCWSYMGKAWSRGAQDLSLQRSGCVHQRVVMHELLHALGFAHEQSRPDRDKYVTVYWQNIMRGMENNFERYTQSQIETFNEPYDYGSIMHYQNDAFSTNGKPTIRPSLAGYEGWERYMGRLDEMSEGDIRKLKKYYQCS